MEEDEEECTEGMDESVCERERERVRKNHRLIADFSSSLRPQGYRAWPQCLSTWPQYFKVWPQCLGSKFGFLPLLVLHR